LDTRIFRRSLYRGPDRRRIDAWFAIDKRPVRIVGRHDRSLGCLWEWRLGILALIRSLDSRHIAHRFSKMPARLNGASDASAGKICVRHRRNSVRLHPI
jgi:hypothetical protein